MFVIVLPHESLEGPPKPCLIPTACGLLAALNLLFRGSLCCPIKPYLPYLLRLLTSHRLSLGHGRLYQSKWKHQWLFLPLLSWLSIVLRHMYIHFN